MTPGGEKKTSVLDKQWYRKNKEMAQRVLLMRRNGAEKERFL